MVVIVTNADPVLVVKPNLFFRDPMYRVCLILFLLVTSHLAHAACSQDILVPFSPLGVDQWRSAGVRTGLSIAYLEEVSRRSGCRFVYMDAPRARAWLMFARGEAGLVLSAVHRSERDQSGEFYSQNVREGVSLVSLKARPLNLNSREDILASGLIFSFIRGHHYGPKTAELISTLTASGRATLASDPETMLRMLKAGRINGAIVLASAITTDAQQLGIDEQLTGIGIKDLDWATTGLYMSKYLPPEDKLLLARAFTELNDEDFYIGLAQNQLDDLPVWVQSSIHLEHQLPRYPVGRILPPPTVNKPLRHELSR